MKRTLTLIVLSLFAFASAANAASVVITANDTEVTVGDFITLTVTVTTSDSPGTLDNNVLGRILHQSAFVTALGNAAQNPLAGFANGALAACTTAECTVMNQIAFPNPINPGVTNFVIATVGYLATNPGVANFSWKTTNPGKFDFFGLTNAPGIQVTVVPIPEPTTAAMLGLGLFGLALAGRRRQ